MTWDEIYEAADGKACGEWELKRKDTARYEVVCFVEDNFGINLETECKMLKKKLIIMLRNTESYLMKKAKS